MLRLLAISLLLASASLCAAQSRNRNLDLMFVVDGSNSMGPFNFNLIKSTIRGAVEQLPMGDGQSRVGVVTFGTGIFDTLPLTYDKSQLMSDISTLQWPDGGSYTHLGLASARDELTKRGRSDVTRVIVLLADGLGDIRAQVLQIARAAQQNGIQMFAVGVGYRIDEEGLSKMVGQDHTFSISEFQDLNEKLKNLTKGNN